MTPQSNPTTIDPQSVARALDNDDRFRRDTGVGCVYHPGKISFREVSSTDSLHVIIDGSRASAHVDRVSPLKPRPDGSARYSMGRVVAHNLSGIHRDLVRKLRRQKGRERCNLECEVVWVDDDSGSVPEVGVGHEPPVMEEAKP